MPAFRPLPILVIAFTVGVFAASEQRWSLRIGLCLLLILAGAALLLRRRLWGQGAILLAFFLIGGVRYRTVMTPDPHDVSNLAPSVVTLTGMVRSDAERRSSILARCVLDVLASDRTEERGQGGASMPPRITGSAMLYLPLSTGLEPPRYGDLLTVRGRLERPVGRRNPGGFDGGLWLARQEIHATLTARRPQDWRVVRPNAAVSPIIWLACLLRREVVRHAKAAHSPERAAVLEALMLGAHGDLSPQLTDAFERTGLTPLLTAAGLHILLLTWLLLGALKWLPLPRRGMLAAVVMLLILYALAAGGRPSLVRAVIVADLFLIGTLLEREPYLPAVLAFSALIQLGWDPRSLFDSGFQFTYAAAITLLLSRPLIRAALRSEESYPSPPSPPSPQRFLVERLRMGLQWLLRAFLVALAAQIGVIPLAACYDHRLAPLSLLVNVPALLVSLPIFALGWIALPLAALHPVLALPLDRLIDVLLRLLIALIRGWDALPGGAGVPIASLPPILIGLLYAGIWALLQRLGRPPRSERNKQKNVVRHPIFALVAMWGVLVFLLEIGSWYIGSGDGRLHVWMLDVGQGDAIVLRTPHGRTIVVDTGGIEETGGDMGRSVVAPFLRYEGAGSIDLLILTHPHADHIGGAATLLREFSVGLLEDNGQRGDDVEQNAYLEEAGAKHTPYRTASAGQEIDCDGVVLETLAPTSTEVDGPPNNASVALIAHYGHTSFLLTGDAEADEETDLLHSGRPLRCDLLKVGHHGSRTSSTPEFLAAVQPRIALISVGAHNRYGHPDPDVIARLQENGAKVYRTDRDGAIECVSNGITVQASHSDDIPSH